MPIDPTALTDLRARIKPAVAEIFQVDWSGSVTKYYSSRAYNELSNFNQLTLAPVEARLIYSDINDPFSQFELNPDLRTETIPFTFNDLDKEITTLFQTHGSGVRCEIWYYYPHPTDPSLDILTSMWFGQLQAPPVYGWSRLQTTATNGYRSRELLLPNSMRPRECRTKAFGGRLPSAEAVRTNLCPYDRHLAGTEGLLNGAVPFGDCPRLTTADCNARFGHIRYFGGFNTDATATVSDPRSGYLAVTKGNASNLKLPIPVIAGTKHIRGAQLLLWRREITASNPDHSFVASVWEIGEGPIRDIRNVKVNERVIERNYYDPRFGFRGEISVAPFYNPGGTISNFSATSIIATRYGWVNAAEIDAGDLKLEVDIDGYRDVAVYNATGAGNGLIGTYYNGYNTYTGTPLGVRIDYNINFPQTMNPPFEGVPVHNWSVEWTGFITFPTTETVTISSTHDDGIKVTINGSVVFDAIGTLGTHSGTFAATAGTPYPIVVRFTQATFHWFVDLKWASTSIGSAVVIPNSAFTHSGSSGLVRQWTNDRAWWLLELYTNNRFGMAYPSSRFDISAFTALSQWGLAVVQFQHTFPDGEVKTYTRRRTQFDASLEGRPAAEQIEDVCRSGAFCVPFQHDGEFTVTPFTAATTSELTNAYVFTDKGDSRNIIWADGRPSIIFEQIPNDKLVNEIILTFDEADNFDTERPITVDDPDQKLLAGRTLGDDNLQTVPMRFAAFGIRYLEEAIRLGYRLLRFGQFDQGGTKNNLTAIFTTTLEQYLGLIRYQFIKIESDLLDNFTFPNSDPIEYFRILNARKIGNGLVEIRAQAYNHDEYTNFETVTVPSPEPPSPRTVTSNPPIGNPCRLELGSVSYSNGILSVEVLPC